MGNLVGAREPLLALLLVVVIVEPVLIVLVFYVVVVSRDFVVFRIEHGELALLRLRRHRRAQSVLRVPLQEALGIVSVKESAEEVGRLLVRVVVPPLSAKVVGLLKDLVGFLELSFLVLRVEGGGGQVVDLIQEMSVPELVGFDVRRRSTVSRLRGAVMGFRRTVVGLGGIVGLGRGGDVVIRGHSRLTLRTGQTAGSCVSGNALRKQNYDGRHNLSIF